MHEMGIANSILNGVAAELRRHPGSRAIKVGVRIGQLAGVDPDALSFAFEALTIDTELAELALDVEYIAPRSRCRECNREFNASNYEIICPACGSLKTSRVSGDELEFTYLEIDDFEPSELRIEDSPAKTREPNPEVKEHEPCAVGRKSSE